MVEKLPKPGWFEPGLLYADGFGHVQTTALRLFPKLRAQLEDYVRWIGPRTALEVGPGDRPLLAGVAVAVYLDLSPFFLRSLRSGGGCPVRGDVFHMPFAAEAFELVVVSDLLTHFEPVRRWQAIGHLAELAPRLLLFNPASGTPEISGSAVSTAEMVALLEGLGHHVERFDFRAAVPSGFTLEMAILYAVRSGVSPRSHVL